MAEAPVDGVTLKAAPMANFVVDEIDYFDASGCAAAGVVPVSLVLDATRAEALLAQLLEAPLQTRESVVDFLQTCPQAAWAARIDLNVCPASGAAQQRIVLEPTQALLDLVAALGATNVDLMVVQESSHGHPSRKEV